MGCFLKTVVATLTAALAMLVFASASAAAAPCWSVLINDWVDGRIDRTYPIKCYQEAIRHLPPDVEIYSSAEDDFRRAMASAFHTRSGDGSGFGDGETSDGGLVPSGTSSGGGGGDDSGGVLRRALDWLGPSNAEAIPTPLLVLAGIALLLLASAAASFMARRIQARRTPGRTSPTG